MREGGRSQFNRGAMIYLPAMKRGDARACARGKDVVSIRSKLKTSINKAVKAGVLDKKANGAAIEAALKLASVMDDPDWPKVGKGFDNVTPSTFLKYCQALHILPPDVTKGKAEEDDGILSHSKWGGTASDGDKGKGDAKDLHSAAESTDA